MPSSIGAIYDFKNANKEIWKDRNNYLVIDVGHHNVCAYVSKGTRDYTYRIGASNFGSFPSLSNAIVGQTINGNIDGCMDWVREVIQDCGDIDHVVVNGGGGLRLYEAIQSAWHPYEVTLSKQPLLSNVRGLQLKAEVDLLSC